MAQQSIVGSLFGLTPGLAEQALMDQQRAQSLQLAQLDPGSLARFGMIQAGQDVGRGLAGLMGVEDPQLKMVRDISQLRSQFDLSTPQGMRDFASALSERGYGEFAMQAAGRAAELDKTIAQAEKARQEKLPNIANLQLYRERLIQGGADPRLIAEVDAEIKGLSEKGTKIVMPGEQQDKELRTARGKKFVDLEDRATNAQQTLQTVSDFNRIIDNSFTGVGAGAKLTAAQVANALGVTVTGTTESEQLDQLFAALTIGQAKNLKGALSDKDVRFLKEAVGTRGLTKETIQSVVNRIARDAQVAERTYGKANQYFSQGGDIAKFDFANAEKESAREINELAAKQQRLNELRRKQQGQP